jgi:non-specific serine/threonine protein kinase
MTFKFLKRLSRVLQNDKPGPTAASDSTEHPSVTPLGIGASIHGRYRLEAEIGRGGMGIVYRGYDLQDQRDVAIKVINFEEANALTRQQFLQEAEINTRLHHPHIVAVYETGMLDTGTQEPAPYIVMEWVQGTSLENIHGLTYSRIVDLGKQICEALEYLHGQGFVYRDLKPGNVLIEKRGFQYFVKLTDFGLARGRGMPYLPNETSLAGSFFYLAPELIAGQPADIPSDLYALGVMSYEMITGHVPFSDFDEQTVLSQHLAEPVIPPSHSRADVPPALEAIVLRLLAKNPKDRFASALQVGEAFEQVTVAHESKVPPGNLPGLSKELIGSENDIAQVKQLLQSNGLVTILEDGERLALAVGAQLAEGFADGVWWVELESVGEPARLVETVAFALGIHQDSGRSLIVSLIEDLREKNLLLLLNHCEHVLSACAQLAETILRTCPDVRILATSHGPLNVSMEKFYRVGF